MGAYLNGQEIAMPYLNGRACNIILNGSKIWGKRALLFDQGQYIDTGFTPRVTETKIEVGFMITVSFPPTRMVCYNNRLNIKQQENGAQFFGGITYTYDWLESELYDVAVDNYGYTVNGLFTSFGGATPDFSVARYSMLIGGSRIAPTIITSEFIGKIYYFRAYENNVLIRDFYPAKSGEIWEGVTIANNGMYCLATHSLYTNLGTGQFEIGN